MTPRTAATASIDATVMTRPGAAWNICRMSFMSGDSLYVGARVRQVRPMTDHVRVVGDGDFPGAGHPEPTQVFGGGGTVVVVIHKIVVNDGTGLIDEIMCIRGDSVLKSGLRNEEADASTRSTGTGASSPPRAAQAAQFRRSGSIQQFKCTSGVADSAAMWAGAGRDGAHGDNNCPRYEAHATAFRQIMDIPAPKGMDPEGVIT